LFLKYKYNITDIRLAELDHEFITNLEHWFKTIRHCNNNTTIKYIKNLRKIVHLAQKNGWIDKDPFIAFESHFDESKRECLNKEELQAIENKNIKIERLDMVRDAFVFGCYTGMAYVDIASLSPDKIMMGLDGEYWIKTYRTKTDTKTSIPILPKAMEIIKKYKNHPLALIKNQVIPIASNQKVNAYLKELAAICDITKTLTFHIARHTFATTVTLSNGVPIESVSEMLGHKKMSTTQIYAKVIEKKVSEDMQMLKSKLMSNLKTESHEKKLSKKRNSG
jgi:Site-specific recombinase XerD